MRLAQAVIWSQRPNRRNIHEKPVETVWRVLSSRKEDTQSRATSQTATWWPATSRQANRNSTLLRKRIAWEIIRKLGDEFCNFFPQTERKIEIFNNFWATKIGYSNNPKILYLIRIWILRFQNVCNGQVIITWTFVVQFWSGIEPVILRSLQSEWISLVRFIYESHYFSLLIASFLSQWETFPSTQ